MRLVGRAQLRRGVYILPALFTLGNLFCGFYALVEATKGRFYGLLQGEGAAAEHFWRAAVFIFLAGVLDGLDGRIARLAHATSPLGIQLDSLADVVSFGVAPGVLVHSWALIELPRTQLAWAVAFVFTACGALRLARFNVQAQVPHDNRHFVGLPIPGGAGAIAALVVAHPEPVRDPWIAALVAVWTVILSLLMVSTIRYPSLKHVDFAKRHPLRTLLWVVLILALVASFPEATLVSAVLLFVASGPAGKLLAEIRRPPTPPGGRSIGAEDPTLPAREELGDRTR